MRQGRSIQLLGLALPSFGHRLIHLEVGVFSPLQVCLEARMRMRLRMDEAARTRIRLRKDEMRLRMDTLRSRMDEDEAAGEERVIPEALASLSRL